MPLLPIWANSPDEVLKMSIKQVVNLAGDGRLLDNSECSMELRTFLSQIPSEKLGEYADSCLTSSFDKSGETLQDIVNELGRRLDFQVLNGLYQGRTNAVGNDGLWEAPEGNHIVVEVKTTDTYRISLDTIAKYRATLKRDESISSASSMLLIVGREDTGELEAQVRGSRHAWDMRLISVDSLVNLVKLKENTEDEATGEKIRSILVPMEYTRLDRLIDVMFTAVRDVENVVENESPQKETSEEPTGERGTWVFTESALIDEKRTNILRTLGELNNVKLVKKSRALYWSSDRSVGIACTISKRYEGLTYHYWYAYHQGWQEFLSKTERGYFVLGCMDLSIAFAIPSSIIESKLDELNTTTRDGKTYWHIQIPPPNGNSYRIQCHKSGDHLDLGPYVINLE